MNQNLWKKWLVLPQMTWGIFQIITRALECLKIVSFMTSFCPKWKMYKLKTYKGVLCHDNEQWCKNWRKIDMSIENWQSNLKNFDRSTQKSQKICTLIRCFWPKCIIFEFKKYTGYIFHDTREWCKIWRKVTRASKTDMTNFANFHLSTWKSRKWDFYGILLFKVENILA